MRWLILPLVALMLAACANADGDTPAASASTVELTPFEQAKSMCGATSRYLSILDDGDTLTLETEGEEQFGASLDMLGCVLLELDVPDSVVFQMDSTRALDGVQSATWDGLSAQWSYHPDNGFSLLVEADQ